MKPLNVFPYDSSIPFMSMRWAAMAVAGALLALAVGAMALRGFNFGLDFTGGTVTELRFEQPVDVDAVRARLEGAGYESPQVQTLGSGNDLMVRLQPKPVGTGGGATGGEGEGAAQRTATDVLSAVEQPGNPGTIVKSDFVGPQVGAELALNGIYALLFVVLGFLIYISFRFEWKFAVAAIITTLQDIVIVLGWFALTQREFDLTVLAGVLSVMGFSINDTIVVFDRVRENFRGMRGDAKTVLNRSINQTLSRTVITSFVAFLTVLALYLYGGGSLAGMAEALLVGIVVGTVSTIFVACPLLLWFGVTKQDLMPKSRDEAELARRP